MAEQKPTSILDRLEKANETARKTVDQGLEEAAKAGGNGRPSGAQQERDGRPQFLLKPDDHAGMAKVLSDRSAWLQKCKETTLRELKGADALRDYQLDRVFGMLGALIDNVALVQLALAGLHNTEAKRQGRRILPAGAALGGRRPRG